MYNLEAIQDDFINTGLVSFQDSYLDSGVRLDAELVVKSLSGLYFNSAGVPQINWKNMEAMSPDLTGVDVQDYAAGTAYKKRDLVESAAVFYESKEDANTGNTPLTSPDKWRVTTLISQYFKDKVRQTIEKVLAQSLPANHTIDNDVFYIVADIEHTIENESKVVGWRFFPTGSDNTNLVINRVGLFFTTTQALTLKVNNQNTETSTVAVTTEANNFVWHSLAAPIEMPAATGPWFITYNQDDLTGKAVGNVLRKRVYKKHYNLDTVDIAGDFNSSGNMIFGSQNWGLGFDVSVEVDLTTFVLQNKKTFAEVVQLQFAYDLLNAYWANSEARANRQERAMSKEVLEVELKVTDSVSTLISRLSNAQARLRSFTKDMALKDNAFMRPSEVKIGVQSF